MTSILHFSNSSAGGAGRAARRTHEACVAAGLQSTFSFIEGRRERSEDLILNEWEQHGVIGEALIRVFERIQWDLIPSSRTKISNTLFSIPYPGLLLNDHLAFATADIIHLHWTPWSVTPALISNWLASGRSVVWTCHDLWPMTGGCHYPAGCEQFKTMCLKCPQLTDDWSIAQNSFREKKAAYFGDKLRIVAPSRWMAEQVQSSSILKQAKVINIPNTVDTNLFSPIDQRDRLRSAFGLDNRDFVILFGSADGKESRKGASIFAAALRHIIVTSTIFAGSGGKIVVISIGLPDDAPRVEGVKFLDYGSISDDAVLVDLLRIADVTCVPSLEDNYPNLVLESLACGTPCVGFDIGGVRDLIVDGLTGCLVQKVGDAEALAAGLVTIAKNRGDHHLRDRCRGEVLLKNSYLAVGASLGKLYSDIHQAARCSSAPSKVRSHKIYAASPILKDVNPTRAFVGFPLNILLSRDKTLKLAPLNSLEHEAGMALKLIAVRTNHMHHSSRSGPYHFLRYLTPDFEIRNYAVPLGDELAGDQANLARAAGMAMGAHAFGQQSNAWAAEADIAIRCAAQAVNIVHYIDGEIGGWILPSAKAELFFGNVKPKFVATFHQPPDFLSNLISGDRIRSLDAVIVLCETARQYLSKIVDPARVHLIPHGIDLDFFAPSTHAPKDTFGFKVLSVGHWMRDYPAALRLFARLKAIQPLASYTIVSNEFSIEEMPPGVAVVSGLLDEELRELYQSAHCLLLPMTDATANNAILEAMACGLPVISTDVGGVAEITGEAALLFRPDDEAHGANELIRLATDAQFRASLRVKGIERAKRFDWRNISRMHERLYHELVSGSPTSQ
jgi:glycosyltransferase involved in cell wall biosynthesis